MSEVNQVSQNIFDSLNGQQSTPASNNDSLGQDEFLKLLVAQMNNQSPLEPQTNGEFLTQMAQFGTVDGIQNLEKSFSDISESIRSNEILQATSLVGRDVLINTDQINYQGKTVEGQVDVPSGTTDLKVSVYDQSGALIHQHSVLNPASGSYEFSWDGQTSSNQSAAHGLYTVSVDAKVAGNSKALSPDISHRVASVRLGDQGVQMDVDHVGEFTLNDVKRIQ